MKLIESKEALQSWDDYRDFVSLQLKSLEGAGLPLCISKDKLEFSIEGKPWKGHAVLPGNHGVASARKLQKAGVLFRDATFGKTGKELQLGSLDPKLAKAAAATLRRLRLPYKLAGVEEDAADSAAGTAPAPEAAGRAQGAASAGTAASGAAGELARQAEKIAKAVQVWSKTEEAATKELRKLQKALLALDDPRTRPVIQGLEGILAGIDSVDDEANAVAAAAGSGDAGAFSRARGDLVGKLNGILSYVQQNELIRQADANPLLEVRVQETLTKSLNLLIKAI